jgi:hypothetical protein
VLYNRIVASGEMVMAFSGAYQTHVSSGSSTLRKATASRPPRVKIHIKNVNRILLRKENHKSALLWVAALRSWSHPTSMETPMPPCAKGWSSWASFSPLRAQTWAC